MVYHLSNTRNYSKILKIAYIGRASGTSLHRAYALKRLGYQVIHINPWAWIGRSRWIERWIFHAGGLGVGMIIDQRLFREVLKAQPDLIWVDHGEFLSPGCILRLRKIGVPIINYNVDDPFGPRDGLRFFYYRRAIPYYDLLVVVRKENVAEAKKAGAYRVVQVWRSADEIAHAPRLLTQAEQQYYASEVAFIGTWMPERSPFMADLIRRGIPISIWGDNWHKAPEWRILKSYWRGPGLYDDKSYSAAILASKICLGLLSKGNRDLHTQRSIEIPALGGLLCAERTSEHLQLYVEGQEAVFWSDSAECAEYCFELLNSPKLRQEIAYRGHQRCLQNNHYNEPTLYEIITLAFDGSQK